MKDKVKKFVIDNLKNKGEIETMILKHLLDTEKYVFILYDKESRQEPPEELLIAGIGHDIERAFRNEKVYNKMYKSQDGFLNKSFLKYHQKKSAEIIAEFLKENNYPHEKVERVYYLISNHETGGDFDANILKDADSISFFINNSEHFINVKTREASIEKVREKLEWMFERITFDGAKQIAKPLFEKAIKKLKNCS